MIRTHISLLSAAVLITVATVGACSDQESDAPQLDVASLPILGDTQQQMIDLIFTVHAEVQRIAPQTAPWKWINSYNTAPCAPPLTGQGEAMFFPDLVTSIELSNDEWTQAYSAIEKLAVDAGLTQYWSPKNTDDFRFIEFTSTDGRTLSLVTNDSMLITGTILCRRAGGVLRGPDNRIPMPPNPS